MPYLYTNKEQVTFSRFHQWLHLNARNLKDMVVRARSPYGCFKLVQAHVSTLPLTSSTYYKHEIILQREPACVGLRAIGQDYTTLLCCNPRCCSSKACKRDKLRWSFLKNVLPIAKERGSYITGASPKPPHRMCCKGVSFHFWMTYT